MFNTHKNTYTVVYEVCGNGANQWKDFTNPAKMSKWIAEMLLVNPNDKSLFKVKDILVN